MYIVILNVHLYFKSILFQSRVVSDIIIIVFILFSSIFYVCDMDLDKIKEWVLGRVDSIAKSLGVEMRVLVLIAFLVGYLIGNWG
jgi:hypothetical protein